MDRATFSDESKGASTYQITFTCLVRRAGDSAEETLGSMSVACEDLDKCAGTWN